MIPHDPAERDALAAEYVLGTIDADAAAEVVRAMDAGDAALRAGNQTLSGFSILRLARTAPEKVSILIGDVLDLARGGLAITAPKVTSWDWLIAAHLTKSEGRAVGKTVVAIT